MPGFETVVRPVVFPNIRPAPTRALPPADDPEQGLCVIRGSGGGVISTTHTSSISGSTHNPREIERRVDKMRVYQKRDDGSVNKKNYIDIETANRIKMQHEVHPVNWFDTTHPNIGNVIKEYYRYLSPDRALRATNIEILETNKIIRSEGGGGE